MTRAAEEATSTLGDRLTSSLEHYLDAKGLELTGRRIAELDGWALFVWMDDEDEPGLETIEVLAHVLDVSPSWLAFGEKTGAPAPDWYREWTGPIERGG